MIEPLSKDLYSNQLKSAKNNSKLSLKGTDTQYSGFIDNNDNKSVDFAYFTDIYTKNRFYRIRKRRNNYGTVTEMNNIQTVKLRKSSPLQSYYSMITRRLCMAHNAV